MCNLDARLLFFGYLIIVILIPLFRMKCKSILMRVFFSWLSCYQRQKWACKPYHNEKRLVSKYATTITIPLLNTSCSKETKNTNGRLDAYAYYLMIICTYVLFWNWFSVRGMWGFSWILGGKSLVLCRTQIFRVSSKYKRRFLSIFEPEHHQALDIRTYWNTFIK